MKEIQTIKVDRAFRSDLASIALLLVHESFHLIARQPYIEEEIECRKAAIAFYRELVYRGVRYSGEKTSGHFQLAASWNTNRMREQADMPDNDELVDYILISDEYAASLTADWVRANFTNYGGVRNRYAQVKGRFVRVLLDARSGRGDWEMIVQILESSDNQLQWNHALKFARLASPGALARSLQEVAADLQYAARLKAVFTRWHVEP